MSNTPYTNEELAKAFGELPDNGLKRQIRAHQGWWRLNVLNQKAGLNPIDDSKSVCNTITEGEISGNNFLTANTFEVVNETLKNRTENDGGMIEPTRLYNNLLSSQPLCFNFFGELQKNRDFGLKVLKLFWKDITEFHRVIFEYSHPNNYTKDSSAFDIGFEVSFGEKKGFIGLECKYTDTFSFKPSKSEFFYGEKGNKNYEVYLKVFEENRHIFLAEYSQYIKSKGYNQLFRNQLMAESMENKDYDVVKTGIFCYQDDESAIKSASEFKSLLIPDKFKIITYADFIQEVQRLELTWEQREWTMLLWARYCGLSLSKNIFEQITK